ncbi:VanZ family protein [Porifericola rhodea]|uniref:VanZ family protein n=1 Tax=Porifericola rhodea TaxID=930972 RepID=UPI0026670994|nr:VanZ family protein [Porifericola rhodea]WKN32538.1 VanZ family protein [Porifericola rhodea]
MKKRIYYLCIVLYLAAAAWILFFFPFNSASRLDTSIRRYVNPIPLETTTRYFHNAIYRDAAVHTQALILNVGGNILLFVPMGILLYNLRQRLGYKALPFWGAALISLSVESIQILCRVGNFDVDDIILNTLGSLLGASLAALLPLLQVYTAEP